MNALYAVLTSIVVALLFPVAVLGSFVGKPGLLRRLVPPELPGRGGRPRLWIHAASVGELGIAQALAGEVRKTFPDTSIVISTMTTTGLKRIQQVIESQTEKVIDAAFFAPLDCPLVTRAFVRRIMPTSFTLVETELWPALIGSLHRQGVPISLVNGRLSRNTFRRYLAVKRLMRPVVERLSLVCVQSRKFSQRFMMLGVSPERMEVIGNVKFDGLSGSAQVDAAGVRNEFGIPLDMPLFVAGSTRPGEEEVLIRAYRRVLKGHPGAGMILAPRHLNRVPEIRHLLDSQNLAFVTRTSGETMAAKGKSLMILDTMGELIQAFACADVTFVGGSLRDFGGHNPLEPAALGKPVLFGPCMEQIGSKELLAGGGAALIHDEEDTASMLSGLFSDENRRMEMGVAGAGVVRGFQGTLARTVKCMHERGVL